MNTPGIRLLTVGIYINAALMLLVLLSLLGRGGGIESIALAQPSPQPIAGGAGLFLMPAQFSQTKWGCYVMDVDAQTLVAYEYNPGEKRLKLAAARNFTWDRQLRNYNSDTPSPAEVQDLVNQERERDRLAPPETRPVAP